MFILGIFAASVVALAVFALVALFAFLAYNMIADGNGFRSGWRYSDPGEFAAATVFLILSLLALALVVLPYLFLGGFSGVVGWFA